METEFHSNTWFITGITGLVGSTIAKKLAENNLRVIALIRKNSDKEKLNALNYQNISFVVGDLLDPESYELDLATCDGVIHTAAAVQSNNRKLNWDINYKGTALLLDIMEKYGIERYIHISTVGVYGRTSRDKIRENSETTPIGPYSESKLAAEREILNRKGIKPTIFRPPYIIGDINFDRHVIPTIFNLLNKPILPRFIRNNPILGFIHAEDIATAVFLACSLDKTEHKVYNIQSFDIEYTKLVKLGSDAIAKSTILIPIPYFLLYIGSLIIDIPFWILPFKGPQLLKRIKAIRGNWSFDTQLLKNDLNWEPNFSYDVLITLLSAYYKKATGDINEDIRLDITD